MEVFAWNKTSQSLIILTLAVRLPPVRVISVHYMQDVTLSKHDAKLTTWN